MYTLFLKRFIDFFAALIMLLLLSPVLVILILFLAYANNGKPFFFQKRPGKDEKVFGIIKFKTMNDKTDENGELLADKYRITKIGKFVRENSLDEIPQLINVLKGDMSLIGPRPLLVQYLPIYNENQRKRHIVKPGITGWAQVNGRNSISWTKKFEYDVYYVENLSFLMDCRVILKTIKKVIKKEGVNLSEEQTSEFFNGNN